MFNSTLSVSLASLSFSFLFFPFLFFYHFFFIFPPSPLSLILNSLPSLIGSREELFPLHPFFLLYLLTSLLLGVPDKHIILPPSPFLPLFPLLSVLLPLSHLSHASRETNINIHRFYLINSYFYSLHSPPSFLLFFLLMCIHVWVSVGVGVSM